MVEHSIYPTPPIERAGKRDQGYATSMASARHRNSPARDEISPLDDEHPLKEIPAAKRQRTLELLRRYIMKLETGKYSVAANYRGLPFGSEPSVTDSSSGGTTHSEALTFSSVGSSISGARTSAFSVSDGSEQGLKGYRHLPEDLRARKALMRYMGSCAACSSTKKKCLLMHHDFQSLLEDPRTDIQAREDIKWVQDHFAADNMQVQSVEDFPTSLDILPDRFWGDEIARGDLIEQVEEVFKILPTVNKLTTNASGGDLYPRTLDIPDAYLLSDLAEAPGDPTENIPYLSLVIIQSSPGGPVVFRPLEGTANFISAVHTYDQSDDLLQVKVARIIENFETWRGFFCPFGRAERSLDMTHVTTLKDAGSTSVSCSTCDEVGYKIDNAQRKTSISPFMDRFMEVADESCLSEASSLNSSIGLSRDLMREPSKAEILQGHISFAQHIGFTDAAPSSGSSSESKGGSQGNDTRTTQTGRTTISSKKRGGSLGDNSNDRHGDTKRSKITGSSDQEAEEGLSFICPFFAFSLVMRYGCSCSNRSFQSMNSLRAHILEDHKEFRCEDCHTIFSKEIALVNHKDTRCEEVFFCKQCFQGFPRVEKLENHWCRKTAVPSCSQSVPRCSQCLERFPSQDQRLKHEKSGCTHTPPPEFRIVDDILNQEIKKSLSKKHWTFATEQDVEKKAWINNNVSKLSGKLPHKQRELIKWIALWECFPFAKSMPDSPFRDLTIPTSDVQINEIMRKVKETMRINLIGDGHPLSSDPEKQEEQVNWFLDSLISTLGQFANVPRRPVPRRAKRTSEGVPPANKTPMTSTPAMFEAVNRVISNTGAHILDPARQVKQGFAAAESHRQPMAATPSTPAQVTLGPLSTAQPLSDQPQISNQNTPWNHGYVYNAQHNQMPNNEQIAIDLWPQIHGNPENHPQHWGYAQPLIGGADSTGASSYAKPPEWAQANFPPGHLPLQMDRTIASHQFFGLNPFSYMGSHLGPDTNDADPDEPGL